VRKSLIYTPLETFGKSTCGWSGKWKWPISPLTISNLHIMIFVLHARLQPTSSIGRHKLNTGSLTVAQR